MFRKSGLLLLLTLVATGLLLGGPCVATAFASEFARTGVATNSSGYYYYGYGNFAQIYIYPNTVTPTLGRKITPSTSRSPMAP